jgi:ubiquinone/menaquinone biosynthesis C-methylase UbiE
MSDINPDMLDVGKRRAVERGIFHGKKIELIVDEQCRP